MRSDCLTSRRAAVVAGALACSASRHPSSAATVQGLPQQLGLGSCCDEYAAAFATVLEGVRAGYRLIDTAAHYDSEPAVGAALAEARGRGLIASGEVCTVTKIWFDDMGYEPALASAMRSMDNLQTERLDALLIHFPGSVDAVQSPARNRKLRADTWRACETLLSDGRVRRIGLSSAHLAHT
jgi:diketogulonate reductase-like aldo/keto reductase